MGSRLRELQVTHSGERHISQIQRAVGVTGNVSQAAADTKKPRVGQSVSWTVQTSERQTSLSSGQASQYVPTYPSTTPQTAPADFTPFLFASTVDNIPQIDCNAHAGRLQQTSGQASSSSNSPGEQRRPVKVINIPPGSSSGGSVSSGAAPPNSRHIRMHFGDSGGVCTMPGPPTTPQRNQAAQNANPHYRTELHTETTVPQPVHSSSIFVNTSNPNHPPLLAKPAASGHSVEGRRAINPPMSLHTLVCDNQKPSGHNGVFSSTESLSFPVQASSPGTVHSKPMFVEIKRDPFQVQEDLVNNSSQHSYFGNTFGRPMPPGSGYGSLPMLSHPYNPGTGHGYVNQYNQAFPSPSGYTGGQNADQFTSQQPYVGYPGSMTLYQHSMAPSVNQNPYQHFNNNMFNYSGGQLGVDSHMPGQTSGQQLSQFGFGQPNQPGQPANLSRVSMLSSRSDSQESEHSSGADFDPRIAFNTSRVSSHSSPSSDKSCPSLDRMDQHHPRTGSLQEETDDCDGYVRGKQLLNSSVCQCFVINIFHRKDNQR